MKARHAFVFGTIICLIVCFYYINLHSACDQDYDWVGPTCGMCWAVSIQYAADVFSLDAYQGMVAAFTCEYWESIKRPTVLVYPSAYPSCGVDCSCYNSWGINIIEVASAMNFMGFHVESTSGAQSIDKCINDLCSNNYCYLIELPSHVIAASGIQQFGGVEYIYGNDANTSEDRYFQYATLYGDWISTITVCSFRASYEWGYYVSVGEITSYSASQSSNYDVKLQFEILSSADPYEEAAVYISSNPLGPARLVESLVGVPNREPLVNIWYDSLPSYDSYYYYYMDHGGPGSDTRPLELLKEADYPGDNTSLSFNGASSRPVFAYPNNFQVLDNPLDCGTAILLEWDLSQDDADIDCYNIYRARSELSTMEYLTSVNAGVSSYVDESVLYGYQYYYLISAAHHGNLSGVPSGCYAIWNDYYPYLQGPISPVDNLKSTISIPPQGSNNLTLCPSGDYDTIRVYIQIYENDSTFSSGVNKDDIKLIPFDYNGICFCSEEAITAEYNSNGSGQSEFIVPHFGGCDSIYFSADVKGHGSDNMIIIYCKSPDINGDGAVNLSDLTFFGLSYNTHSSDSNFCDCYDFNWDEWCDLGDFALLGEHYEHGCPVGSSSPLLSLLNSTTSSPKLELEVNQTLDESIFEVAVVLVNADNLTDLVLGLDNENSSLEFLSWIPNGQLNKTTLLVPVENGGDKILFLGSFGGDSITGQRTVLGVLRYRLVDTQVLSASIKDGEMNIPMVFGEAMDSNDEIHVFSGLEVKTNSVDVPRADYLSNNYPNPFNPLTVIEYGIARDSNVQLSIYNVAGQLIKTLVDEQQVQNHYSVTWKGKNENNVAVSSGVYFYRLKTNSIDIKKKLILLR